MPKPLLAAMLHMQAANVDATLRRLGARGAAGAAEGLQAADAAAEAAAAAAAAEAAGGGAGAAGTPPRVQVSPEEAAEAATAVGQAAQLAAELHELFSSRRPDLAAGCLAVIHAPAGGGGGGAQPATSLVRVDLSAAKAGPSRGLGERFLALPRAVAESLADAPSPDAQLALLRCLPEWRFAGRQAAQLASLVAAVRRQREGGGQGLRGAAAGAAGRRVWLIPQQGGAS